MGQELNIKMLQSEYGATGEYSPNLQLVEEVAHNLLNNFEHDHDNITRLDSCFFLVQDKVGNTYSGDEACMRLTTFARGCNDSLVRSLVQLMNADPHWAEIFHEALYKFLNNQK